MPEEVLLSARGLAFEAGGARLIDGIDLDIRAGARVAVMGANGAGKSLLLRLLHGLIPPGAGEIRCAGGRSTAGAAAPRRWCSSARDAAPLGARQFPLRARRARGAGRGARGAAGRGGSRARGSAASPTARPGCCRPASSSA